MKKKVKKYQFGNTEPIMDNRTQSQKMAWDNSIIPQTYPSVIKNDNALSSTDIYNNTYQKYDMSQSKRDENTLNNAVPLTKDTNQNSYGVTSLHPAFQGLNIAMLAATGIADTFNNAKITKDERRKYIEELQNDFHQSNTVTNSNPIYTKYGGGDSITDLPNSGGSKEFDAIPTMASLVSLFSKDPNSKEYLKNLKGLDANFGEGLSSEIQFLNKRLSRRGGADINQALSNIAKEQLSTSSGHPMMRKFYSAISENPDYLNRYYYGHEDNKDIAKMAYGGKRYSVEAEAGEVYTDQEQNVTKIPDNEKTHEEGGVPLNNVDRVLENTSTERKDKKSAVLKVTPDMFKEMFGIKIKKALSHADAAEKATKYYNDERLKVQKGIEKSMVSLEKDKFDKLASNSVDLNLKTAQSIPDENHVFDLLFDHQENVKSMLGLYEQKKKAKYGIGDDYVDPYAGGKTKKGSTTPTGKYNKDEDYLKAWEEIIPGISTWDNKKAQGAIYDYMLEKDPQAVADMWRTYGMTSKGLKTFDSSDSDKENFFMNKKGQIHESNFSPEYLNENLATLKKGYVDGYFGARQLEPPKKPFEDPLLGNRSKPVLPKNDMSFLNKNPVVHPTNDPLTLKPSGQPSKFNEPLHWEDTAGALMTLTSNERIPTNYNPAEFNEITPKLLNPTPALEAGNRNFNAAIGILPNSGAGMANVANTFSSKYSLDNQVLAQYEQANVPIINDAQRYNANVRDRQSVSDQQSRAVAEEKQLGSMEAQREQKLSAFDDLFTRVSLNRKVNREGNLLMKMFPNFDQTGNYNGNQRYITNPLGYDNTQSNGIKVSYVTDPRTGEQFRIMTDEKGRQISQSKIINSKKRLP